MLARLRRRLTYANVMATIAVFVALGGSSYAALRLSGSQIRDRTISGKKLKPNTLGGTRIAESRLGAVPRARNADRVGGKTAAQLTTGCPPDTIAFMAGCVERTPRPAGTYSGAAGTCESAGRRLPTHQELRGLDLPLAPGGELTANVYPGPDATTLNVLVARGISAYEVVPDRGGNERAYRCVAAPGNQWERAGGDPRVLAD
jgi:hypothetical protein